MVEVTVVVEGAILHSPLSSLQVAQLELIGEAAHELLLALIGSRISLLCKCKSSARRLTSQAATLLAAARPTSSNPSSGSHQNEQSNCSSRQQTSSKAVICPILLALGVISSLVSPLLTTSQLSTIPISKQLDDPALVWMQQQRNSLANYNPQQQQSGLDSSSPTDSENHSKNVTLELLELRSSQNKLSRLLFQQFTNFNFTDDSNEPNDSLEEPNIPLRETSTSLPSDDTSLGFLDGSSSSQEPNSSLVAISEFQLHQLKSSPQGVNGSSLSSNASNASSDFFTYFQIYYWPVHCIICLLICSLGIFANVTNIIVLTR